MVSKSNKEGLQIIGFSLILGGLVAYFYIVSLGLLDSYPYREYSFPLLIMGIFILGIGLLIQSPEIS
jgi:hypothetical protein